MQKTQYPLCIRDERLSCEERTFKYCRPAVILKRILCNHPKCKMRGLGFKHINHFKHHIERIYGVKLGV
ncbi:hypothetical protein F5Y03DRAFT_387530 [Xylaria venustula]|nr:hypothetical protein F5Y03DRAFT_387530 [Xylaria venustula]